MIHLRCPNCHQPVKAPESLAGNRGSCPTCGEVIQVPAAPPRKKRSKEAFASLMPAPKEFDRGDWIDMTAMVDIVFFLLVFFMVTSITARQASIEMPAPKQEAGSRGTSVPKPQTLEDANDDNIIVRIDADDATYFDDTPVPSSIELTRKLKDALQELAGRGISPTRVVVVAHGDSRHGTLVSAVDAAQEAGADSVKLTIQDNDG